MPEKIEERIQSIGHIMDWSPMPIRVAETMSVDLKKKVSMDLFTF